jgi:hypothetical protein
MPSGSGKGKWMWYILINDFMCIPGVLLKSATALYTASTAAVSLICPFSSRRDLLAVTSSWRFPFWIDHYKR